VRGGFTDMGRKKMRKRHMALRIIFVSICFLALNACAKKTVPIQPELNLGTGISESGTASATVPSLSDWDDPRWREVGIYSEAELKEFLERAQEFENEDIYFDYDAFVLMESSRANLDRKVDFLRRYPGVKVTIEGHCDERGTNEYNLALGEQRANNAWQYLVNSGIDPERLSMISYGEERPIAFGNDEASWALNRRGHFLLHY
jgi:peptidoglycan-associated lipoprotein